jgi:nicotinate-nucleotide adenylyltransferase
MLSPGVLYFGGSFNPIHVAHLICSAAAARQAGCTQVVLIPSRQPVLKSDVYPMALPEHRLAMVQLAVQYTAGNKKFAGLTYDVDTVELERAGPSYTIDTVKILRQRGAGDMNWLIGADQLLNLHRWHRFEDLIQQVQFKVMQRPGYTIDWQSVDERCMALQRHVVSVPQLNISATIIRRHIQQKASIDHLVPDAVRDYIVAEKLYE